MNKFVKFDNSRLFDKHLIQAIIENTSQLKTGNLLMSTICGLKQKLKASGHKLTLPRLAVIEVLETYPEHLTHIQILEEGQKIYPKLSRATVYRTMELLVALNLVRPLYLNDPTQRFVSASGGHHHLVCSNCGTILEFDYCTADQLTQKLSEQYQFQINSHLLEFQGICQDCQ
jgi:Fur family ferric uptake transcriptional regulator